VVEYIYKIKKVELNMFNYDTIIKQLEAMSPAHQDEFAQKLIEKNSGLATAISTKINIAHQDKYYTDTEAMNESLKLRGHA
jgi:hypothetical protein|tara:strand:+ start:174 stop:416 length:243 start_codon:yes stop_codon:yes gene_type:complete